MVWEVTVVPYVQLRPDFVFCTGTSKLGSYFIESSIALQLVLPCSPADACDLLPVGSSGVARQLRD